MIIDGASHIANWKDYEGRTALHLGKSTVCQKYNRCCIDGHPITFPPADLGNRVLFYGPGKNRIFHKNFIPGIAGNTWQAFYIYFT